MGPAVPLWPVAMWKWRQIGVEEGRRVKGKKKGIETAGIANCNQGNGEKWDHTEEPGKWKEETRGEQKAKKEEENIPLVRLCECGASGQIPFLIFKHLSDMSSRELSFNKQ